MSASSYDEALARLLVHEGGYSNHPSDPGGPTNWGITIRDARAYWKQDATASDVRNLPLAVAKSIYRSKYWAALACDELPAGVDYAVFDYGVNSGIGRAAKVLQRLLGVHSASKTKGRRRPSSRADAVDALADDGTIGPRTLAAAACADAGRLIDAICDERLAFLQGLRTWPVFGNGWGRRVREVRAAALALAAREVAASKMAAPKAAVPKAAAPKPAGAGAQTTPARSQPQGHREVLPPGPSSLLDHLTAALRHLFHKPT
jgi:lysozyme family protein